MSTLSPKIISNRADLVEATRKLQRPLVFTNGCFDILHRGHTDYLEQAADMGSSLLVAVNSDESVKRLDKGSGRPFNSLENRMSVLAALACTDLITPFDEDTPLELIELLKPDVLVKGGDWKVSEIVGADFVTANGGKVEVVPVEFQLSSTDIVDRIRKND